jgi:hypothetical protein
LSPAEAKTTLSINRAPVLTLWAAVVAERLGYRRAEALTLGKAVAGLNAQSKGRRLGIFEPRPPGEAAKRKPEPGARLQVELLQRVVPAVRTRDGLRALHDGKPMTPESVERYLESKFKDALDSTRGAMEKLARSLPPEDLAVRAFGLYEKFRPAIPAGKVGWGAAGVLDLELIRSLAGKRTRP